ncbi:MAG: rhomboid family intramembrane serine protease [Paludibacter sp.]|nr:rhomboid family intramembrane serine protease [Paludibacter sp.]
MNNYRPSFLNSIPPVVKNLIAINIILFLATLVTPGFFNKWGLNVDLTDILGMHYWASDKFNPAQLVTYMFMHGGFGHIFFNMFALYMFGGVLEQMWGTKRFLFYYLVTGVGAGIIQQLFWSFEYHSMVVAMNDAIAANSGEGLIPFQDVLSRYFRMGDLRTFNAPAIISLKKMFLDLPVTIGASGSVFGLLLAFGWLFPEVKLMLLFFPVPIKARIFVLIYGVAELFLGVARFSGDSVAHFAHLGGMLFGAFLILYWKKKRQF